MKKTFLRFTYLLSALILFSCSPSNDVQKRGVLAKGDYYFTMYDSTGAVIMKGTMTIDNLTKTDISGTYKINDLIQKNFEAIGVMEGKFNGSIDALTKAIFINTNPMIADANVFFNVMYNYGQNKYIGEWRFSVFRRDAEPLKGKVELIRVV
jgi:hypothetical protein